VLTYQRPVSVAGTLAFTIALTLMGSAWVGQSVLAPASPASDREGCRPRSPWFPARHAAGIAGAAERRDWFDARGDPELQPRGWGFTLNGDRLDGDWRLDGDVDDGSGPGSLLVEVTAAPTCSWHIPVQMPSSARGLAASSARCPTAICSSSRTSSSTPDEDDRCRARPPGRFGSWSGGRELDHLGPCQRHPRQPG
jgi:hypothetical protein